MILLTCGRIFFGGFLCLPDSWVMTLLVTEFVVSPTHDCTTFSPYGSDVYTCIEFNKIVLNLIFFLLFSLCSFGDAAMCRSVLLLFFYAFFLSGLMSDVFLSLPFLDSRLPFTV